MRDGAFSRRVALRKEKTVGGDIEPVRRHEARNRGRERERGKTEAGRGSESGKMLIRIPETPGIPAVLREIAALCPRHSPTAATRLFSFLSSSTSTSCSCSPTIRHARARTRVHAIYRGHDERASGASRMVTLTLAHTFSSSPPRSPLRYCRLFEVKRSTDNASEYIGHPAQRPRTRECRGDLRRKGRFRRRDSRGKMFPSAR